jgi:hypothetical protein
MEFAPAVYRSTDSVFFWGENRTAATALALCVALRTNAPLVWLDVRDPSGREEEYEELLAPLVPRSSRYLTRTPEELAPEVEAANLAVWTLVRADEPKSNVSNLIDFLRLPAPVQALASEMVPQGKWAVLLVTNTERLAPLYPEDVASTAAYVDTLKHMGIKLVSAFTGSARKDRFAYDHVYRLEGDPGPPWDAGRLRREKGLGGRESDARTGTPIHEIAVLNPVRRITYGR